MNWVYVKSDQPRVSKKKQPTPDSAIEKQYRERMNHVAQMLDLAFNGEGPKKVGFLLGVFQFGDVDGRRFNYISNGNRRDMVILLKEMLARFEGQPEIGGTA